MTKLEVKQLFTTGNDNSSVWTFLSAAEDIEDKYIDQD